MDREGTFRLRAHRYLARQLAGGMTVSAAAAPPPDTPPSWAGGPSAPGELRRRAEGAPIARLATVGTDGRPHLVPCCFAVVGDVAYSVVDHKPKRSTALRRLDNIRANPAVSLLVDHYADDWRELWWVRFDGDARLLADGPEHDGAIVALCAKYPQYRATPPTGTVLALDVTAVRSWSATPT